MSVSAPKPEVPKDWETIDVGSVCEVQNGFAFKSIYFNSAKGLPLIRIRDVHSGLSETFYSGQYEDKYVVNNDDLLIGMDGEFKVRKWKSGKGLLNQRVCRLIPNEKEMIKDFLYYSIGKPLKQIEDFTPFTTVKHISAGQIRDIELPLPSRSEQQKISYILSTVQKAIEQQEKIIQTTTELKKALMQKLFTEGLRGEKQKMTEIGLVPESWEVVHCESICNDITVGIVVKPTQYYVEKGVPAFRSQNVREDFIQLEPMIYISESANNNEVAKSKLSAGDILIVRTGYPGTSCVVPDEFDGSNCIDLIIARPNREKVHSHYLSRFFNSDAAKVQVLAGKVGLAQQHYNVGAVKKTLVPVPQLKEQLDIVRCLEIVDKKINLAKFKLENYRSMFANMLNELMTAKIRVD